MDSERRKRLLIIVTAVCVGGWLADTFVISPVMASWEARTARIEELERRIAESASLLERENDLRERWQEMRKGALSDSVSDAERAVLEGVSRWASDSRLTLSSIKPRWIQVDNASRLLEIQVEGNGGMEAVTRFVYEMERDALPLRMEEFQLTSADGTGAKLSMTARFTGLVLERSTS